MGIGVSFFTETVGAGPRKDMDIAGLGMADGAELRVHPTGKAVAAHLRQDAGPGPRDDVRPDRRRGARHPARGRRGRARRHRPDAVRARHLRQPLDARVGRGDGDGLAQDPRQGAADRRARRSRSSPDDLEWEKGRWFVKGDPEKGQTIQELALASHGALELPEGVEGHLDAVAVYDPPNLTYPVRRLHLRRRRRPGDGRDQAAALHRRRRLRRAHQPDDRRGPDPRAASPRASASR